MLLRILVFMPAAALALAGLLIASEEVRWLTSSAL
jgi:hypothetical protein